jgi:hypothetical protein
MGFVSRDTRQCGGRLQMALADGNLEPQLPWHKLFVCQALLHTPVPGSLERERGHVKDWLDLGKSWLCRLARPG